MVGLGGSPANTPQSGRRAQIPVTQYHGSSSDRADLRLTSTNTGRVDDADADYPPLTAPVAPVGASIAPFRTKKTPPILFYEKKAPFYEFTNFSPHDVHFRGKRYPTSEHLFQSFKFLDTHPEIAERVRECGERPMLAFDEAHRYQSWVRDDWRQVNVEKMEIALRLKFTQHPDLKAMLLGTGDAELIEDSPRDYFWGIGANGTGRNELGKALVRLREELRHENEPNHIPNIRRATNRFSVQDFTTLVSTLHPPAAPRYSPIKSPSSASPSQRVTPTTPKDAALCEFCQMRPKYQNHPYCGRTCANETSRMCSFCRLQPKYGKHPYCSRTCATKAGNGI
ncbi:DUF1768-domain-containing protein [Phlebopus sp. FC_14]|nr:DUF1768-domain-containing protein [Phlebopus sp. FC_14]